MGIILVGVIDLLFSYKYPLHNLNRIRKQVYDKEEHTKNNSTYSGSHEVRFIWKIFRNS